MNKEALRDIKRKKKILTDLQRFDFNITRLCGYYGISRDTFYRWKKQLENDGEVALINSKPCPQNPKLRTPKHIEDMVIKIRKEHHLGPQRISWYLERYFEIKLSQAGVRKILVRNNLRLLPKNISRRSPGPKFKLYSQEIPGHQVQVDVKICIFREKGKKIKRYQYTAIDDATRVRGLQMYDRHTQQNAIKFVKYISEKFPFRIKQIRTDNGSEFQSQFHWFCQDIGIEHVYIKKASPHLNGKVERSHSTDKQEFYQLLNYKGDQDLRKKLAIWENFYNHHRPHGSHGGKTPYEILRNKLK